MPSDAGNLATHAPDVDRLISDLKPLGRPMFAPAPADAASRSDTTARAATPPGGSSRPRGRLRPILPPMRPWMVRGCVAQGVLLGVAITQWPYGHACGWGLSFYSYAVAMVLIASVWGLLISWKSRLGFTHAAAMATLIWGLTLAGGVVLPRVGYAKAAAGWSCSAPARNALVVLPPLTAPPALPAAPISR